MRMSQYQNRTRRKTLAILNAAERLFFSKGYTRTGIQEIAGQAKVSPTSIYNYFGSKKELLTVLFRRHLTQSIQEMDQYLDSDASFPEKLSRLVTGNNHPHSEEQNQTLATMPWDDPEIQSVYRSLAEEYSVPMFRKLIRLGKEENMIPSSLEEDAVIAYVRSMMTILTAPDFLKTSTSYKESISQLFFFGLLGNVPPYLKNVIHKEGD
jgi:AcrR family transcriptional regulator